MTPQVQINQTNLALFIERQYCLLKRSYHEISKSTETKKTIYVS